MFSSGKFHIKIVQKYGTGTVTGLYFIYFLECIKSELWYHYIVYRKTIIVRPVNRLPYMSVSILTDRLFHQVKNL